MAKKSGKTDNNVFVNSNGMKVPCISISMLEMEAMQQNVITDYKQRGEPIEPPTYEVEVAGGGTQPHPLTINNLEVEDNPDETTRRKVAWALHQDALDRMNEEMNSIRTGMILEGIDIQEINDDKWFARMKRLGVKLPENQEALIDFYKKSQVVRTPEDILGVELKIIELSTGKPIPPERRAAVEAKFRSTIYSELEGTGELDKPEKGSGSTA
jgi:hypothetical protein